jgi:hypothetical protein
MEFWRRKSPFCLGDASRVRIDGGKDFDFLARAFHKLLINFTCG